MESRRTRGLPRISRSTPRARAGRVPRRTPLPLRLGVRSSRLAIGDGLDQAQALSVSRLTPCARPASSARSVPLLHSQRRRRRLKEFRGALSPLVSPVRLKDDQPSPKEAGMKYALLIYPKPGSHEALGEDESRSVSAEYWAFREDPRCLGGAHLQPIETATTVRYGGGENLIIDGPVRRFQGGARRLLRVRSVQSGRGAGGGAADSGGAARRRGRGAPARRGPVETAH